MTTRLFIRVVGVTAAITLSAAPASRAVSAQSTGGRLVGRAVEASDARQPVRRAIVTLTGGSFVAGRSAITDEDGRFAFEAVPAGNFSLAATRPGYLRAVYGAVRPGRPGTPVSVRAGATLDVTLPMTHGSALSGVLRDAAGDLAPGMRVQAIRIIRSAAGERGEAAGAGFTDDRGEFRIFGLAAGDYVLAATPSVIAGIGDIGAPDTSVVDAMLVELQRRRSTPAPASSATPPGRSPSPMPALEGYATAAVYLPGVVNPGEATRISLGVNDVRERLDFSLRLSRGAGVTGSIQTADGSTAPVVQIGIRGNGPDLPVFGGATQRPSISQNTNDHTFRMTGVAPGHYRVFARSFGAPGTTGTIISSGGALPSVDSSGPVLWAETDIDVSGVDLNSVTLMLQRAPRIAGRLQYDTGRPRLADASAVRVILTPASADAGGNGLTSPIVAGVNRDGTFEFPAVIPGLYQLTAVAPDGWWMRAAVVNGVDTLDAGFQAGPADLANLGLMFSDRRPAIAGTLTLSGGRPALDYVIVAFTADRAMWRAPSRRIRSTRPATNGAFEIADLPPGSYYLAALTDVDPADLEDAAFLEGMIASAVAVVIGEGERKVQDLRIAGG